jgi:predicted nicotinamide N-methyase
MVGTDLLFLEKNLRYSTLHIFEDISTKINIKRRTKLHLIELTEIYSRNKKQLLLNLSNVLKSNIKIVKRKKVLRVFSYLIML